MTCYSRVTENGDVVVSAMLVSSMGLKPGEEISLDRDGNEIVLKTFAEVVRAGQQAFRATIKCSPPSTRSWRSAGPKRTTDVYPRCIGGAGGSA